MSHGNSQGPAQSGNQVGLAVNETLRTLSRHLLTHGKDAFHLFFQMRERLGSFAITGEKDLPLFDQAQEIIRYHSPIIAYQGFSGATSGGGP